MIVIHSGEYPYMLAVSVIITALRRRIGPNIVSHMKRHVEQRPRVCPKCDRTFAKVALLKHHFKGNFRTPHNIIHSGEKPFACGQCEYRIA